MIIHECQQGSPEWHAARLGKLTASHFDDAIAGGGGVVRKKLMDKLIAERWSGTPQETYSNTIMDRGLDVEQEARDYYADINGCKVRQIGFIERDADIGASPDGLVGTDGMLEIKCPLSYTHIKYIRENRLPPAYAKQVQGQLWVAEREWCDFVSFDPRLQQRPYFYVRVYRDEDYIKELQIKIYMFIADMKAIIEKLTASPF